MVYFPIFTVGKCECQPKVPRKEQFKDGSFFNDTAPTEIYNLSLHDVLPIYFEALADQGDGPSN